MVQLALDEIRSNYNGFARLSQFAEKIGRYQYQRIEVDMASVGWLDANMCAPLGALLYKAARRLNNVTLNNLQPAIYTILCKNGFLSTYGHEKRPDTYGTTIEYRRFGTKDDRDFAAYIERRMVGKGLPQMSAALTKKFRESLYEIFSNAVLHSGTQSIFACGQFFPKKERIDFSITDLGIGFREQIRQNAGLTLDAEESINWAMSDRNTTKKGAIPGGLGLKILREFISLNKGRIQIASDTGYWEFFQGKVMTTPLPAGFPGAAVNIEIRTDDHHSYKLADEISGEDIF